MQLVQKQHQAIIRLAENYHLKMILLFGSQADGTARPESDVDIAVLPAGNMTFEDEIRLNSDLINILGNVDLTNLRKAPPLLMKEIADNCHVLYEKENTIFNAFEVYAFNRYAENKPLFQITNLALNKFVKNTK